MKPMWLTKAGFLVLSVSAPFLVAMTDAEVHQKVEVSMQQAHVPSQGQWHKAVDALIRAGVAPEKCVDLVQAAIRNKESAGDLMQLARDISDRTRGDSHAATRQAEAALAKMKAEHAQAHPADARARDTQTQRVQAPKHPNEAHTAPAHEKARAAMREEISSPTKGDFGAHGGQGQGYGEGAGNGGVSGGFGAGAGSGSGNGY